MIALLFSLILDFKVPLDYFYEEKKQTGISVPVNRKQRRLQNGNK